MSNVVTAKAKCKYVTVTGHKRKPKGSGTTKKKTPAQKAAAKKTAKKAKK